MSLRNDIREAVASFNRGELTFEELRTYLLLNLAPEEDELLFAELPASATVRLVGWLHGHRQALKRGAVVVGSTEAEEDLTKHAERFVNIGRRISSKVSASSGWLTSLNFDLAAANTRADTFGDWYHDPWSWPELEWLAKAGRDHIAARQLAGPKGNAWSFEVPKPNGTERRAAILDPVERLLYQACVDNVAPAVNEVLPDWVFGWRLPIGINTVSRYARQDYQWRNYVSLLRHAYAESGRALVVDVKNYFQSVSRELIRSSVESVSAGPSGTTAVEIAVANGKRSGGGLPQRSAASSVIGNLILSPVGTHFSRRRVAQHATIVRWMDDTWVFARRTSTLKKIEDELVTSLARLGLEPNKSKSGILEGDELKERLDYIGVDVTEAYGVSKAGDRFRQVLGLRGFSRESDPLGAAFDAVMSESQRATRRQIVYVIGEIKRQRRRDLAERLAEAPGVFARQARLVASVFKKFHLWDQVTPWYLELLSSETVLPVTKVDFISMYPADAKVPFELVRGLTDVMARNVDSEIVEATVTSRLAKWKPEAVQELFAEQRTREMSSMLRRAFGLAAVHAGVSKREVRRFLRRDDGTYATAAYLDAVGFDPAWFPVSV